MELTVTSGERAIIIKMKGSKPSQLRRAERTARRLLQATQKIEKPTPAFGFTATSETQLAPEVECPF